MEHNGSSNIPTDADAHPDSIQISDDLLYLIRMKNVRRRQYQRTRDPALLELWRAMQKEIKRQMRHLKSEHARNQTAQCN